MSLLYVNVCAFVVHLVGVCIVFATTWGAHYKVKVGYNYNQWLFNPESLALVLQPCTRLSPGQVDITVIVVLFSVISGAHHLFAAICCYAKDRPQKTPGPENKWLHHYVDIMTTGVNPWRWLDYGISSALMMAVQLCLLQAPLDLIALIAVVMLQFLVCALGFASEYVWSLQPFKKDTDKATNKPTLPLSLTGAAKWCFGASTVAFVAIWVAICKILAVSANAAGDNFPVFVWVFTAYLVITFFLFPINHAHRIWNDKTPERINASEVRYICLSFIAKVPLMLLYALSLPVRDGQPEFGAGKDCTANSTLPAYNETNTDTDADAMLYGPLGGSLLVSLIIGYVLNNRERHKAKLKVVAAKSTFTVPLW